MDLIEVIVDLDALEKYCQGQGLKNTSGTRAQYAAHLLSEQHPRQKQLQQGSPVKPRFKNKQWKKIISFSKCLFPERMSHVASTTEALKCLAGLPLSPSLTEQIE